MFRSLPLALLLVVSLAAGACTRPELNYAETSAAGLARAVLEALERGDTTRLRALALSESEFHAVVWPELPAAKPERNLPAEYVWGDLRGKSDAGLRRIVAEFGGEPLEFVGMRFGGATTQYRTYVVHREAMLTVRRRNGLEETKPFFGSVLERSGQFKVFSYVID